MTIIAKIETVPLRIPFRAGSTSDAALFSGGDKNLPAADSLLVKVTTGTGVEGWGAANCAFTTERGRISVPDGPGLGIDPNPDVISAYRVG
jgi:L-alanine-DL-glutamate epimerase-like enolase superfamily enzyme